ncbi:MAG: UDP-N-acetylglucosamine 2-epimerase (non-hydrolyzing) [Pseudomonadota bacterium]
MKITTVIGARPQFIKASFLSRCFCDLGVRERLLHTGQHYDANMSEVFFEELQIPKPARNLGVGGQGHGAQTGQMLSAIEADLLDFSADAMLVYGDTNSTLAGALAAAKLHIPVIHIEAGLRSFDKKMPEEINRILTDHVSDSLLCPTPAAVENLKNEGISSSVHLVGDVMHRVLLDLAPIAKEKSTILERLSVFPKQYYLSTIHRAENTDDPVILSRIMETLTSLNEDVVLPLHPRTKQKLKEIGWDNQSDRLKIIEPVGYLDMLALTAGAKLLMTDSGGLQKEAAWLSTPCITLRDTTEWVETIESGWNTLVGTEDEKILSAINQYEQNELPGPMQVKTLTAESFVELFKQI